MDYLYPNHYSPRFLPDEIDEILVHCESLGFSDLHIQTDTPMIAEIHGRKHRITERKLQSGEVLDIINHLNGSASQVQLSNAKPINNSYDITPERGVRYRYRINAVGAMVNGRDGIKITARAINPEPPSMEFLNLDPEIIDNFWSPQGIVLVTGATGSGKSTLLAGMIADLAKRKDAHKTITTAEAPIEYVYDSIEKPSTVISQLEVPRHLRSFEEAIENAMRQAPDIIVVGEMRDRGSISAGVMAAQTGHLVLSTVHTNGVAETVRRMVNVFPGEEQSMRQSDIVESLRLVLTQRLLPTVDGKRAPIREYHIFKEEDREALQRCKPIEIATVMRDLLNKRGHPMRIDAEKLLSEGRIDQETYRSVMRGYGD